jgi:hypothetical protein
MPIPKPAAISAPPTIQGVRRPKRDRLASDRAPVGVCSMSATGSDTSAPGMVSGN